MDKIRFSIESKDYDIIHVNGAYAGSLPLSVGKPYILHCRGSDVRENLKKPIIGKLTKKYIIKADKVLVSTPDLVDVVKPLREDVEYVPNGIETDIFKPKDTDNNKIKILLSSALTKVKGGEKMIKAIKIVKEKYPDIEVNASGLGKEPVKNSISNIHRILSREDIEKIGINLLPVFPFELIKSWSEIIQDHDIILGQFVLGSLGMSDLEAMSCGKPLITYLRDIKCPAISTASPDIIAKVVIDLIENKELRIKKGEESREWILKYHDAKKISKRLKNIYEEIK